MATTQKAAFKKALSQTEQLDAHGLTPFVALHLGAGDMIHLHRTSSVGFVATDGAPDIEDPDWVFVSYSHLQESLRFLDSEKVEIIVMPTGGTLIRTTETAYESEVRVHTVHRRNSGFKRHTPGETYIEITTDWLNGLNTRPLSLSMPPTLRQDCLILPTQAGIVTWKLSHDPKVPSFPREAFLRAISGGTPTSLDLTMNGFYHAVMEGVHVYIAGHQIQVGLQLLHGAPGEGITLPATRLIYAVEAATGLAGPNSPVTIGARLGVTTKNSYGNTDRFSLGEVSPFPNFSISTKTAKLITDVLKQAQGEEVILKTLAGTPDVHRMTRGDAEVSFRSVVGLG